MWLYGLLDGDLADSFSLEEVCNEYKAFVLKIRLEYFIYLLDCSYHRQKLERLSPGRVLVD